MLQTANRKVAIDTSTDIKRVVIASIDHHSIVSTKIEKSVDQDVDCVSTEVHKELTEMSIECRSWVNQAVPIDTR